MERWSALSGLRLFDATGQPAAANAGGTLTCASCHATHGPAPDGADHLRLPGWKAACSACHGPDALLLYRSFHRREARQ